MRSRGRKLSKLPSIVQATRVDARFNWLEKGFWDKEEGDLARTGALEGYVNIEVSIREGIKQKFSKIC